MASYKGILFLNDDGLGSHVMLFFLFFSFSQRIKNIDDSQVNIFFNKV